MLINDKRVYDEALSLFLGVLSGEKDFETAARTRGISPQREAMTLARYCCYATASWEWEEKTDAGKVAAYAKGLVYLIRNYTK